MQVSAANPELQGMEPEALIRLIETIRAEKTALSRAAQADHAPVADQSPSAGVTTVAPGGQAGDHLPALGRHVNVWA